MGSQLALKLAHEFALHLDELYQVLISHVVKVAGVADFFLLGEQVQFAAQQFQRLVGGTRYLADAFPGPLRPLGAPCAASHAAEIRRDSLRVPHQRLEDPCA